MFSYIATEDAFYENITYLIKAKEDALIGIDIETTGLDFITDNIRLIQLNIEDKKILVFNVETLDRKFIEYVLSLLENKKLVAHNAKFELKFIYEKYGILFKYIHDTMITETLIHAGVGKKFYSLEDIVNSYFNQPMYKEIRADFESNKLISKEMIRYAADDVKYLLAIYEIQLEKCTKRGLLRTLDLEMRLLPVIANMEHNGININKTEWKRLTKHAKRFSARLKTLIDNTFREEVRKYIDSLENPTAQIVLDYFNVTLQKDVILDWKNKVNFTKRFYIKEYKNYLSRTTDPDKILSIFFKHFNPASYKQKVQMLNWMGIETDTSNAKALKMQYPDNRFIQTLIRYGEEYKKGHSFGENMLDHIHPKTNKIHTELNQVGAWSGRLASSNPNMQNIIGDNKYRHCFVASDGYKILTADYSQIELRVLAELSGEKTMIDVFQKDGDLHRRTAAIVYGKPDANVTKHERSKGKGVNFAIVYGTTEKGLAYNFGIPELEARDIIRKSKMAYPILSTFIERAHSEIVKRGFSTTPIGRKRYFSIPSDIFTNPNQIYELYKIQRRGFNHIIQGCAADIIKYAICNVYYNNPFGDKLRLLITVHDEIVIEVHDSIAEEAVDFTIQEMMRAAELFLKQIPVKIGFDLKPYWTK